MNQTFMTINIVRMAAFRRNAPIQALSQLCQYPCWAAGQRRQAVEQSMSIRRHCLSRLPLAVGRQRNGNVGRALMMQCQQPFPGIGQRNNVFAITSVAVTNTRVERGVGHDASVLKKPLYHAGHIISAQAQNTPHARKPGGLHVSS